MAEPLERALGRRLRGARKVAVVGVGDELQASDRLGILAARDVEGLRLPGVKVFLAGTTPESFTAPIRRYRPERILLLDAADMGERPGSVAVVAPGRVAGARLSTHALPLTVVIEYLEETTGAAVILVGIQPDLSAEGSLPTSAEKAGLTRLMGILQRLLHDRV